MNEKEMIKEARKRGYRTGVLIDYEERFTGTDTLGRGEFAIKDGNLIKYENELKDDNPSWRRFDTVWRKKEGWTKIVDKKHGVAL